jgi:hypothetical protein
MNDVFSVVHGNIKRFQNLLETSVEDTERQTIQSFSPKKTEGRVGNDKSLASCTSSEMHKAYQCQK